MSFLKKKPAKSDNLNRQLITNTYTPAMQQGVGATSLIGGALGVPGGNAAGADAGFARYSDNAGFSNVLQRLTQGITGGQAARGLLRSGSTSTRLLEEGTALNQQYYNNYLQNLLGLGNLGLGAGQLVTSAGQRNVGERQSTAGAIASTVGKITSIFSDRRLKQDIRKIDEMEDGLGIYEYRYAGHEPLHVGVMADEVGKLRPWALGEPVAGFATVDYGRL